METIKQILEKWEKQVQPTLQEDLATVDLCDHAAATSVMLLIQEIREVLPR